MCALCATVIHLRSQPYRLKYGAKTCFDTYLVPEARFALHLAGVRAAGVALASDASCVARDEDATRAMVSSGHDGVEEPPSAVRRRAWQVAVDVAGVDPPRLTLVVASKVGCDASLDERAVAARRAWRRAGGRRRLEYLRRWEIDEGR